MATFRIHEDFSANTVAEKDSKEIKSNRMHAAKGAVDKQMRQTFAVLNNLAHGRPHAQSTAIRQRENIVPAKSSVAIVKGVGNDENEAPKLSSAQTIITSAPINANTKAANGRFTVPVDQFKAFCVDENVPFVDEELPCRNNDNKILYSAESTLSKDDCNVSEMRQPLQELQTEFLETPISMSDVLSPMSVDKTIEKCEISFRTERERLFQVEEYQMDIIEYLREAETKHLPKYGYMRKQPDINYSMRKVLVDWLVEVCEEYRLHNETLCLAVSYIDRFLSIMSVVRGKLQLVGTAAMFIASKYEEIYPPEVSEFVYITDNTYSKQQVLRMEQFILKALTFDLCVPTTYTFITAYTIIAGIPDKVKYLATYVAELSLLEAEPYLQYLPSKISAAAIVVACYNLGEPIWSDAFQKVFGYTLDQIKEIIFHLSRTHVASIQSQQQAIQEKYKSNKYLEVSLMNAELIDEDGLQSALLKFQQQKETDASNDKNNENVRKMISSLIFV